MSQVGGLRWTPDAGRTLVRPVARIDDVPDASFPRADTQRRRPPLPPAKAFAESAAAAIHNTQRPAATPLTRGAATPAASADVDLLRHAALTVRRRADCQAQGQPGALAYRRARTLYADAVAAQTLAVIRVDLGRDVDGSVHASVLQVESGRWHAEVVWLDGQERVISTEESWHETRQAALAHVTVSCRALTVVRSSEAAGDQDATPGNLPPAMG